MNNKVLLSLSFAAAMALNVQAEKVAQIDSITVEDTTLESHIKSIDLESLDNAQASDIKDILKSMPSVVVSGNARYSQKVYIRGLEDKSSNITIDGAKMSGQLFHHSGDQTIDAETLKIGSIELGPNSALSGAGVINGSFVYETKDASDYLEENESFGGKISTSYQSAYSRKSTALSLFGKVNEHLEIIGIGNYSKDGVLHTPNVDDESKKSTLKSGLAKLVYKINPYNTVDFSYNKYQDGGVRQLSAEKIDADGTDSYNEIVRDTYTLNYEYNPSNDLIKLSAKVYTNSQKLNRDDTNDGTDIKQDVVYENKVSGFDLRNTSVLDNHALTYGIESYKEEQTKGGKSTAIATGITTLTGAKGKGITKSKSIYFEDEIMLDRMTLNLGLRYDIHELGGLYTGKNKQLSPKFKGIYQASENLSLRVGYGRIFKGPSLGETLMLSDSATQSENSEAQTGHNIEIGFDYDLSNVLNTQASKIGFTAYKYNVDNYMHATKNSTISNQTNAKFFGLETMFTYKEESLKLNLSHTYSYGNHVELDTGNKYNPSTAKIHTFRISTDYSFNNNLSLNYNSELVPGNKIMAKGRTSIAEAKRKGYGVHNISGTYKLTGIKGAKISLGIDNVFNKEYVRHTNFIASSDNTAHEVGRNIKVKLSYRF